MNSHGYAFVLTPIDVVDLSDAEIIPRHKLVRANANQVKAIKGKIQQFIGRDHYFSPYENDILATPSLPLEPAQWRYWIIEFEGPNLEIQDLQLACGINPNDLELGFTFIFHNDNGTGFLWDPFAIHSFFSPIVHHHKVKTIAMSDMISIRRNYEDIKKIPNTHMHIQRSLRRFNQLNWLPRTSEMVVIGLFSVIESLVSHAPARTDSTDSLSHQLRAKIPMLNKRYYPEQSSNAYFPALSEESIWTKLYAYRSKIVHGEDSQLTGTLQGLKNIELVISFLRETSKQLLRLSIREPEFMSDLKKC